ncbi:MAG TPA: universal stress protein [Candidatus Limnocylindria bacterium]|nr:universal stress protein [Candidatus Limnocylindria bacterium]
MSDSPFRRILVAVDGSAPSTAAIRYAVRLARATGARLIFCHAVERNDLQARRDGHDLMDAACDEARAAGLDADLDLTVGSPVEAILAAADARGAQLIVMGTHGRTGAERLKLGSVAERVVRSARSPVLTVHADER